MGYINGNHRIYNKARIEIMKDWLIKLLSDASGNPSTRLHLAWLISALLLFYVIYQTLKALNIQVDLVYALIFGISTMSGLSILDKDSLKTKVESIRKKLSDK
jgi:hypothetical protein